MEEWQQRLGIQPDQIWDVDARTKVTVFDDDGTIALWAFTPGKFGGWQQNPWPATVETVNGGTAGQGASGGVGSDPQGQPMPNYCYLFGAGQGAITEVRAERLIGWKVVNPAIDAWVAVFPWEHGDDDALSWELVGL